MTREEAIQLIGEKIAEIQSFINCAADPEKCYQHSIKFCEALDMAISALREQCVRDAAKTSGEAVTDSHQLETVTNRNGLNCIGIEAINRIESDTVKGVEIDQFNAGQHGSNTSNALGGWISIKDRRPEYKTRVLFVDVRGLVFLAIDSVDWDDGRVSFLEPASGLWVQGSHWMPLPEPPKEEVYA